MNDTGGVIVLGIVYFVMIAIGYVWMALATSAVLRKAGAETWPGWVPIYNGMVLFRIAGMSQMLGLLFLVGPIIPFVWLFLAMKLNPRFGVGTGYSILAFFVPVIWLSVLGWGSARWLGDDGEHGGWGGEYSAAPDAYGQQGYIDPTFGQPAAYGGAAFGQQAPYGEPAPVYADPQAGWPAPAGAPSAGFDANDSYGAVDNTALVSPQYAAGAPFGSPADDAFPVAPSPATDPWNPAPSAPADAWNPAPPVAPAAADAWNPAPPAPADAWAPTPPAATDAWNPAPPAPTDAWNPVPPAPTDSWNPTPPVTPTAVNPQETPSDPFAPAPTAAASWPRAEVPVAQESTGVWTPPEVPSFENAPARTPIIDSPFAGNAPAAGAESFSEADPSVVPAAAPEVSAADNAAPATRAARAATTRMSDDSEMVAQARAAQTEAPAVPAPVVEEVVEDAPPIVVPGRSSGIPGVVPPPPLPMAAPAVVESAPAVIDPTPAVIEPAPAAAPLPEPVASVAEPSIPTAQELTGEEPWAPRLRRERMMDSEDTGIDLTADVSAVAGAPAAGAPLSALSTVSALQASANVTDDDDFEATQIAVRRRPVWKLQLPMSSRPVDVTGGVVLLGRKPDSDSSVPDAQLIPVADGTRTISKNHARLDLVDGVWNITDLGSTNGVVLLGAGGEETELTPGIPVPVTERFLLGDAELGLTSASN